MYSNKDSFDKYMKEFEKYLNSKGLKKCTLSSYKSDCENFYKFWQKYREKELVEKETYKKTILKNNLQKEELDNINSKKIPEAFEGELKERTFLSKTRNQQIVNMVKQRDSYKCIACNFHYNNKIVQAHHLIPLKDKQAGVVKADDLITLCPTCHDLAHVLIKTDASYQNRTKLIKKLRAIVLNK